MNLFHRPRLAEIVQALERITASPLLHHLTYANSNEFIEIVARHWKQIGDAAVLPKHLSAPFCREFWLTDEGVQNLWTILRPVINFQDVIGRPVDDICRTHAPELAGEIMLPPVSTCINPECGPYALVKDINISARLYTLLRGIVPVTSTSSYCKKCNTRYYPDYYITKASHPQAVRQYYTHELKTVIHVHESSYVEVKLCEYFEQQMVKAHVSSRNIAELYNWAHADTSQLATNTTLVQALAPDVVLDAFFLNALLRDKNARGQTLQLPHHVVEGRSRYDEALEERNFLMVGNGQEMWAHACQACTKIIDGEDGKKRFMSAVVTDGVTIGHPCCSVHDCQIRLASVRDRFCPAHSHMSGQCSVSDCTLPVEAGHITCATDSHRQWETDIQTRKYTKARKEQQKRAVRAGVSLDNQDVPEIPSTTPKLTGRAHRRWTHNEQLVEFLKATFPAEFPNSLPPYAFYDAACKLLLHLLTQQDHYFDDIALVVDAFHAACHAETDKLCQECCHPRLFPELRDENGKWVFNSSAAEQINVWFGAFQSIVREMSVPRYTFFLDEMIALHNRALTKELERKGLRPHLIPIESLRRPREM